MPGAAGFARKLADDGVGPGHRVAVVLPNHWTFAVAMLSIWKLGATAVPLSPLLKPEELQAVLSDVDPDATVQRLEPRTGDWDTAAECAAPPSSATAPAAPDGPRARCSATRR